MQLFLFELFFLRRKKSGEALTQSGNLCCQNTPDSQPVRGRTFNNLNFGAVIKPLSIKQNPKNTLPLRQGENWKETPICDRCAICIVDISQKIRYNIIQTAHDKKPHKSVK